MKAFKMLLRTTIVVNFMKNAHINKLCTISKCIGVCEDFRTSGKRSFLIAIKFLGHEIEINLKT